MSGRSYDPYKVDNHYAKFLLESRSATDHWDDHFDAFMRAHRILREQMTKFREGLYPFRVASTYIDFIEARHLNFTTDEKNAIRIACLELLEIGIKSKSSIQKSTYYKDFVRLTKAAVDFLNDS
jgi:hypothetical protein